MAKNEYFDTLSNTPPTQAAGNIQWRLAQMKSSRSDKSFTCVDFNYDGDLLAAGTKCGNVFVFNRKPITKTLLSNCGSYKFYSYVRSHDPEFDFLKSQEIEEKINKLRWLRRKSFAHLLLSTNDKTIKLWKVSECYMDYESFNTFDNEGMPVEIKNITSLRLPRIKKNPLVTKASPTRVFANLHAFNIHSISPNSDQETFLSADELRINVWNLEVPDCCFNVVDIKPKSLMELTEVISCAEFHPIECNIFAYSTYEGAIRLCDMRSSTLCNLYSKQIKRPSSDPKDYDQNPLNCIKISPSGRYLMARDYLYIYIYDLKMENKLIEKYLVHDFLRKKASALFRAERTFDKFDCCWSGNDNCIMTGTYNNFFKIFNRQSNKDVMLEAKCERMPILKPCYVSTKLKLKTNEIYIDSINYENKIQHTAWHPKENTIAVAASSDLFIYKENS